MKKRYLYSLLLGLPGFTFAILAGIMVTGAASGFLWLYVFGDDTWPASTSILLTGLLTLTIVVVWVTSIIFGYHVGKKLESNPDLNRAHVVTSIGLTLLPLLVIVLQQWRVGNLGPKTEGQICNEFCLEQGYSVSEMPPKISGDNSCRCLDDHGNIILSVPVDTIETAR